MFSMLLKQKYENNHFDKEIHVTNFWVDELRHLNLGIKQHDNETHSYEAACSCTFANYIVGTHNMVL